MRDATSTEEGKVVAIDEIKCASTGCQATIKNNKWDRIRGGVAGWFFSRGKDESFCPLHVPKWVADWRAGRVGRM